MHNLDEASDVMEMSTVFIKYLLIRVRERKFKKNTLKQSHLRDFFNGKSGLNLSSNEILIYITRRPL